MRITWLSRRKAERELLRGAAARTIAHLKHAMNSEQLWSCRRAAQMQV